MKLNYIDCVDYIETLDLIRYEMNKLNKELTIWRLIERDIMDSFPKSEAFALQRIKDYKDQVLTSSDLDFIRKEKLNSLLKQNEK